MQTNFTLAQLADPDTAVAEKILRTCVHCGFCTATCPTYVTLGDELDSPRGRIYLIKDMLENDRPASDKVALHIDRCLSCLSCMTTCPSGVDYMHLVDQARVRIEKTYRRPWADRLVRNVIAAVLPNPARFRMAIAGARLARPFLGIVRGIPGLSRFAPMIALAPKRLPPRRADAAQTVFPGDGVRQGRVAMLRGCAQSVLDPGINQAAVRLLNRKGVEVVFAAGDGCCGALVHHMGRREQAHAQAKAMIDAWIALMDGEGGLDAILVTTSGCGTTVKDYGFMFRDEPDWAEKARRVSAIARDVTEYLETLDLGTPATPGTLTVAYHSACSLQHGQQIKTAPKTLLARAGFTVREPAEGHLCCGSAGTYNMLQPELSAQLRARKVANIEATGADVVAAGNLGCMTQIGMASRLPIVHTVELLDWAHGGPRPAALDRMAPVTEM